jgi:glutathione S-transferase
VITVHHLENSRSHRIVWLLEELGAEYEIEHYKRDPKTQLAPPELRNLHPLGKSPVITDGNTTVAESAAIIEYILDAHDDHDLVPDATTDDFLRYRYWLHYAEGSAMGPLLLKVVFNELPRQGPLLAKPILSAISKLVSAEYIDPQIERHARYWEDELSANSFFAGDDFSAADIQMSFPLQGVEALGIIEDGYPKIEAFLDKIRHRPAYQRAIERGGRLSMNF